MSSDLSFTIKRATEADVSTVLDLRVHAENWLANAQIEQWTASATGEKSIRAHIERGATFLVLTDSGNVCATFTLDGGDPDFWTDTELAEPCVYLYKFIVHSNYRGKGLGDALLNWVCQKAETAGASMIRLDCWRTNYALHTYYRDRGFVQLDIRSAPGRKSGALFERKTSQILPVIPPIQLIDVTSDDTQDGKPSMDAGKRINNYDPTGEAAVWQTAARMVSDMKGVQIPGDVHDHWNAALEQAARALDVKAREIRQAGGMYYRVMNGVPKDD